MVLRNVQPTFTFEEQRVEINELASDVESISTGYNNTNWDTAFSWGNHSTQNYIVNGTFSNITINAGITTRNLTITDDGSASPIFISRADDQSVWNLSLQNDGYSTNAGTGTKFFMGADGTAKWYHYGYSTFENTEFWTSRVVGSPSSYLAFKLNDFGGSELYYQGSYRAGSTSWGFNVTGNLYASQGMDIPDGYAFHAGNSDDLRLGHNATSSYIDNYTGALDINNYADDQDVTLRTDNGSGGLATYVRCDGSSGATILYHYGTEKFTTTSTGVEITGTVVSDPTATGVAGYGYELKNGGTSLGGLYKTSSNGGYLQLNNVSGTLTASINGEDGAGYFSGIVGVYGGATANTSLTVGMDASSTNGLRINSTVAGTDTGGAINVYNSSGTRTALIQANGAATFNGAVAAGYISVTDGYFGASSTEIIQLYNSGTKTTRLLNDGSAIFEASSGNTDISIGDSTSNNGRLVLTAKASSVEIHSRGNHPIDFLFNTTTKATLGINGDLSLAGGITLTGQTATAATGASATSDAFDHYEEGTWTPGAGSNFTGAFTDAQGYYTRIGNTVFVTFQFNYSGLTSSSQSSQVTGLPFDAADRHSGTGIESTGSVYDNDRMYLVWAEGGQGSMYVATGRPLEGSASTGGGFIRGSFTYPV